jgi:signal transduction histidine kinase
MFNHTALNGPVFDRTYLLGLQRALSRVVDELAHMVDADGSYVYWVMPDRQFYPLVAGGKVLDEQRAHFFTSTVDPETDLLAYRVLGRPVTIVSNRVAEDPRLNPSILNALKAETALAIPVLSEKHQLSGLVLLTRQGRANSFTSQQTHLAESISAAIALSLENAQLYLETQSRLVESQSLHQIILALLEKLELEEVLQIVCSEAQRLTRAQGSAIALLENDDWLRVMHCCGETSEKPGRVAVGQSLLGLAVRRQEPVLINNHAQQAQDILPGAPISLLALPMRVQGRVIGVIDVVNKAHGFSADDVHLIQLFADQAAVAVEHARLSRQVQELAVTEERHRLSRELHDSVNQLLYGISLYNQAALKKLEQGNPEAAKGHLEKLGESTQEALKEMRLLIFDLRPSLLDQMGLQAALTQRLKMVEERLGFEPIFKWRVNAPLDMKVEEALYGITQEALNNVIKHSNASNVTVHLIQSGQSLILKIMDDGIGFDTKQISGGMGLNTMRERAESLDAQLEITSTPGEGTQITVEVKL